MVSLKRKFKKIGSSLGITIPKAFFDEGLLKEGKEYYVHIEEIKDKSLILS